jgi:DNA-directed RNA polymerase specialized sigma24 family protein
MSCKRILSDEELAKARELRQEGYTNRKIAEIFEVSKTTIWDNIYRTKPRAKRKPSGVKIYRFRKINIVLMAVNKLRGMGYNSKEIAIVLQMPLNEVNVCLEKGFMEFKKQYPNYFK